MVNTPNSGIEPDTKDWTWVLREQCPECSANVGTVARTDIALAIRQALALWPVVLRRPDVRERTDPAAWSTLEYGAHVRDVLGVFTQRLDLLLAEDDPEFADWDSDAAAAAGDYLDDDPAQLAELIEERGEALAATIESLPLEAEGRTGRRSNGSAFTVTSLLQYLLHDLIHHAWDVTDGRRGAAPTEPEPPDDIEPESSFAHRNRKAMGIAGGVLAIAIAIAHVFFVPPQATSTGIRALLVRWTVPAVWSLIAVASLCWAVDVQQRIARAVAYAALGMWIVYLAARLL